MEEMIKIHAIEVDIAYILGFNLHLLTYRCYLSSFIFTNSMNWIIIRRVNDIWR